MEIRKADSKGRVTGFEPGELYAFDRQQRQFSKVEIFAPDGTPVVEALRRAMGSAEEAEYLLNLAMRNRNLNSYEVVD